MSGDGWGRQKKQKKNSGGWAKAKRGRGKRDAWDKARRGRHKREFGATDKAEAKKDKAWGKTPKEKDGEKGKGLFGRPASHSRVSWLSKWLRPERVSLVNYYHKLDQLQAHEVQAGVREQLAAHYQSEMDKAESVGTKLQRFVEGITRKRLSSGQIDGVKDIVKDVVSPNQVIAFVTNLFK